MKGSTFLITGLQGLVNTSLQICFEVLDKHIHTYNNNGDNRLTITEKSGQYNILLGIDIDLGNLRRKTR